MAAGRVAGAPAPPAPAHARGAAKAWPDTSFYETNDLSVITMKQSIQYAAAGGMTAGALR